MEKLQKLAAKLEVNYIITGGLITIMSRSSARPLWEEDEDGLPSLTALGQQVEEELVNVLWGKGALLGTPIDWADKMSIYFECGK